MKKESITEYMDESKDKRAKWSRLRTAAFLVALGILFVIGLCFWARPKTSEAEKRELDKFPALSLSGLMDGSFFSGVVSWYGDTYPVREGMIKAQNSLENSYGIQRSAIYGTAAGTADEIPKDESGAAPTITPAPTAAASASDSSSGTETVKASSQDDGNAVSSSSGSENTGDQNGEGAGTIHDVPESMGTVYVADGMGFELYYFSQENADTYASMLNTVSTKLDSSVNIYDMIVPNSFGVNLDDDAQAALGASNQKDAINYVYSRLDSGIKSVPVFDTLRSHNGEYLYFRTDHHWTATGAWYAYQEFCSKKGIEPHGLDYFTEEQFPGFLGTFYTYSNRAQSLADNPDTVYAYVPKGTNDITITQRDGNVINWNIVADASGYGTESKYMCFIGGDNPYSVISNPSVTDGSSCVILKESYGNCFVPYLVDHYQNVYVIDYRYYTGDLTSFIRDTHVSDVIFLNNVEAVTADRANMMLGLFP
ncbi:DHHW family protein [Bilifractor porci]|uniref:DHHW protein n=1 Tax=Bilifractor porci TaxID=2606636 RepID=A0A7X2P6N4_9FIRM|nr:DHHW family protein [Bilifractor porci]MST80728.1 hypothetical protein [Bilifractor porci]